MDKVFMHLLSNNAEVYVDDMVELKEMLSALTTYNLWLNLQKCVFEVDGGKLMGFMLTYVYVQWAIGKLTTISCFLPRLAENTRPMNKLLKNLVKFDVPGHQTRYQMVEKVDLSIIVSTRLL
ncbi:hypothetical protein V8G54_022673 [Vigna mungo]|uniref:Reverse transcriptase domain-containing protein n=1 Tax=Vigna mungo TaxID=3915 RepID=A0AAQ3N3M9_VIGMU